MSDARRTFCPEDGRACYTPKGPEPEGFRCANYELCKSFERPANPPLERTDPVDFVPCPLCKQYSHSIREDKLGEAILHFETMIAHPVRGHPMCQAFDDKTRDAAQVLMAAAMRDASPDNKVVGSGIVQLDLHPFSGPLIELRQVVHPLTQQGEDRIWRAAEKACKLIDKAEDERMAAAKVIEGLRNDLLQYAVAIEEQGYVLTKDDAKHLRALAALTTNNEVRDAE